MPSANFSLAANTRPLFSRSTFSSSSASTCQGLRRCSNQGELPHLTDSCEKGERERGVGHMRYANQEERCPCIVTVVTGRCCVDCEALVWHGRCQRGVQAHLSACGGQVCAGGCICRLDGQLAQRPEHQE